VSAFFTQCSGDTVQTGTGKVDPAQKFKCTTSTAAREQNFSEIIARGFNGSVNISESCDFQSQFDPFYITL